MTVKLKNTGLIILTGDNVYFRENVEKHLPPNLVLAYDPAGIMRAYDFIRMAAIGGNNIKMAGSHAGVSIGEDGPSQMGLEDLAAFRAVLVRPQLAALRMQRGALHVAVAEGELLRLVGTGVRGGGTQADASGNGSVRMYVRPSVSMCRSTSSDVSSRLRVSDSACG